MLPARSRVRTPAEHKLVTRSGRRVTRGPIVVHALLSGGGDERAWVDDDRAPVDGESRAGFVVGRKVGNAVIRNRVRRRLREQMRTRLDRVPPGGLVIVRALPSAASASSMDLGRALDSALRAVAPTLAGSSAEGSWVAAPRAAASTPGQTSAPHRRPEPVES